MTQVLQRTVCNLVSHDMFALAYPPARRWECTRCGLIVEDAPTSKADRRRFPRETIRNTNETDRP
jgi:hypothetical protein